MRAPATVVRLMPSPTNRITFFARPFIAPRRAAWAAPSRNHQAGVSPSGCLIAGTSTSTAPPPGEASWTERTVAQAPIRAAARARVMTRNECMKAGREQRGRRERRTGDYANASLPEGAGTAEGVDFAGSRLRHDGLEQRIAFMDSPGPGGSAMVRLRWRRAS